MGLAGTPRALALLVALGWTAVWAGCVSLETDGTRRRDTAPPATGDGGTDATSDDVAIDGGLNTDASPNDADPSPRSIAPTDLKLWVGSRPRNCVRIGPRDDLG